MPYVFEPNQELTIRLTAAEWNIVLESLANGAFRVVAPVLGKLNEQMAGQQKDEPRPVPAPHLVS